MNTQYEAVFCIVNAGFADQVMFCARKAGAAGGTIFKGHGSSSREAQESFNITIQPEKEIVMMIVPSGIKDNVLKEIYNTVGLDTEGMGIAFSLPVAGAVGLRDFDREENKENDNEDE